jgi:hypothetical protein
MAARGQASAHVLDREQARTLHQQAQALSQRQHLKTLLDEQRNHLEGSTNNRREAQKEADRDHWEQKNGNLQTLLTSASVLFAAGCAIIVEGVMLPANCDEALQVTYMAGTAVAFGGLFLSIVCSMILIDRMSQFMQERVSAQRGILAEMQQKSHALHNLLGEKLGEQKRSGELLDEAFTNTCDQRRRELHSIGARDTFVVTGRRASQAFFTFDAYYEVNCLTLELCAKSAFLLSATGLLGAVVVYAWAQMTDDAEPDSSDGAALFVQIVACFWALAIALFYWDLHSSLDGTGKRALGFLCGVLSLAALACVLHLLDLEPPLLQAVPPVAATAAVALFAALWVAPRWLRRGAAADADAADADAADAGAGSAPAPAGAAFTAGLDDRFVGFFGRPVRKACAVDTVALQARWRDLYHLAIALTREPALQEACVSVQGASQPGLSGPELQCFLSLAGGLFASKPLDLPDRPQPANGSTDGSTDVVADAVTVGGRPGSGLALPPRPALTRLWTGGRPALSARASVRMLASDRGDSEYLLQYYLQSWSAAQALRHFLRLVIQNVLRDPTCGLGRACEMLERQHEGVVPERRSGCSLLACCRGGRPALPWTAERRRKVTEATGVPAAAAVTAAAGPVKHSQLQHALEGSGEGECSNRTRAVSATTLT